MTKDSLVRDRGGQYLFQAALLLPLLLVFAGLAADGGLMYANFRRAQLAMDTAAHAASHAIDVSAFFATNQVVLDANEALALAREYGARNSAGRVRVTSVTAAPRTIIVRGRARLPVVFMRLAGIHHITVTMQSTAYPAFGLEKEGQ